MGLDYGLAPNRRQAIIIPPHNKVVGGWGGILVSLCPSVHPSVRPAFHVRSVVPTVLIFWQFFKIYNFDFILFWLGIWGESLVWVIMGQQRVSQNAGVLVVVVWTNADLIHWCIYAALGGDESTGIRAGISNHIHSFLWDIFTHPCPDFTSS